ncbi:hypothetical protein, partial [Azotobacter beijerinckii]|uniref:hypothetical protein n=1 Tax=Azotobacter beijerinckii TaxID=170623 RepID=UPI0029529E91
MSPPPRIIKRPSRFSSWNPQCPLLADSVEKLVLLTVGMLAFGLVTEGLARHFSWPFDVLLSLQARV